MTTIRMTNAAETLTPDLAGPAGGGASPGPANDSLPPIDASPLLMRAPGDRRAIPGFDGEAGGPFDVADLVRQAEDVAHPGNGPWPDIRPGRRTDAAVPAPQDAWNEVSALRAEVARLRDVQDTQNAALRRARDEIVELDDAARLLRAQLAQQEKEAAAAGRTQQQADEEKAALRVELEQTKANFAELLQQTAELNTAFDEREREIAAVRRNVTSLKAQLAARAGETDLNAAIAEAKARYYNDFNRRCAQFEAETEKLARVVGAREERIRSLDEENAALKRRCDALAAKAAALETGKRTAEEKLESQSAMVTFLDSTLQAERETTGRKIAELASALQGERLARAAETREAAVVCKEIVQLLPRLARPFGRVMETIERAAEDAVNDSSAPQAMTATS